MISFLNSRYPVLSRLHRWACGVAVALLCACGGGGGGSTSATMGAGDSAAPSVARDVAPVATDVAISTSLEPHYAINPTPSVPAKQRLLVFLPGTFGKPANYRLIVQEAAAHGLHSIGLNYPNNATIASLCNSSTDANCNGNARLETLTGTDSSTVVNVTRANSIENRLIKLLQYLQVQAPLEGWGDYLTTAGQLDWSRIRIAGHSQGGGHAAFIAKSYAVDRAIYFGSPADLLPGTTQTVPWLTAAGATAAQRQAGFTHERDELALLAVVTGIWRVLGLPGSPQTVDAAPAGFNASRQLVTNAAPTAGNTALSPFHSTPIVDGVTPLAPDGRPVFAPVWKYLCFD
jgi:dienelactone hydrolase